MSANEPRVLAITKIFPSSKEPASAPFNRQQLVALAKLCPVEVMATIPWFPGARWLGRKTGAAKLHDVPRREPIAGLDVIHPRFLYVPGLPSIGGPLYAASLAREVLARRKEVDVVLGTWAYPDGFAAVALARALGVPSVVKLHGSDINVLGAMRSLRPMLRLTLSRADRVVAVSAALGEAAVKLGARPDRVDVVMNGVDTTIFHPGDKLAARRALGLPEKAKIVMFVGRLEEPKGAGDALEAFRSVAQESPDAVLVLVGEGSLRGRAEALSKELGGRVVVAGLRPHHEVPEMLRACDILTLPSWNEGTPNVVLEAFASGRPVVASDVGGIPALLVDPALGALVPAKHPKLLAGALLATLAGVHDEKEVVRIAGTISWGESAERLRASLTRATAGYSSRSRRNEAAPQPTIEG